MRAIRKKKKSPATKGKMWAPSFRSFIALSLNSDGGFTNHCGPISGFHGADPSRFGYHPGAKEREFFIDNLLVRISFIIVMIRWTGLAPREFESPFPGSLTSTFLPRHQVTCVVAALLSYFNTFEVGNYSHQTLNPKP